MSNEVSRNVVGYLLKKVKLMTNEPDPNDLRLLTEAGLIDPNRAGDLEFAFSAAVFNAAQRERFDEYKDVVGQHEGAVERSREGEGVDPMLLRVLDQKRSRIHNGLADLLMESFPIDGWDHEQFRRWIAAMLRHELPWLKSRVLPVNRATTHSVAYLDQIGGSKSG